jgi:hypothetical protein
MIDVKGGDLQMQSTRGTAGATQIEVSVKH